MQRTLIPLGKITLLLALVGLFYVLVSIAVALGAGNPNWP